MVSPEPKNRPAGHPPPAAAMARTKNPVERIGAKVARPRFGRSPRWRPLPPLRMVSPEPLPEPAKKRAYRFRPGTVALREIRRYQRTTGLLLPFVPFVRLVKEISTDHSSYVDRWSPDALLALQTAAEYHVIDMLEIANLCAIHANRVTI